MSKSSDTAAGSALDAMNGGRSVFTCTVHVDDLTDAIEAVEAIGWKLEHVSTSLSPGLAKLLLATCVFRRT